MHFSDSRAVLGDQHSCRFRGKRQPGAARRVHQHPLLIENALAQRRQVHHPVEEGAHLQLPPHLAGLSFGPSHLNRVRSEHSNGPTQHATQV